MVYTSYFAKLKSLPDNIIPISICAKAPDWYKGLQYKKLAPSYDLLMHWKNVHDEEYYKKYFKEQVLDKLDVGEVIDETAAMVGYENPVDICLTCYEKPTDFCHRHLVSKWFRINGIESKEWIQ